MATALELTRKGWSLYVEAMSRRPASPELTPEEQQERRQLLTQVREAAAMLKQRFAVRRVVLFGSLAHASRFFPKSDVDLAVEGLLSEDYWEVWRLVEEFIGGRPVDFIAIEDARESLRHAIDRYGVEL